MRLNCPIKWGDKLSCPYSYVWSSIVKQRKDITIGNLDLIRWILALSLARVSIKESKVTMLRSSDVIYKGPT